MSYQGGKKKKGGGELRLSQSHASLKRGGKGGKGKTRSTLRLADPGEGG